MKPHRLSKALRMLSSSLILFAIICIVTSLPFFETNNAIYLPIEETTHPIFLKKFIDEETPGKIKWHHFLQHYHNFQYAIEHGSGINIYVNDQQYVKPICRLPLSPRSPPALIT